MEPSMGMLRSVARSRSHGVIAPLVVALALSLPGRSAVAQIDPSAHAARLGLVSTPVGAFVPSALLPPLDGDAFPLAVHALYAHWQTAPGQNATTNVGLRVQTVSESAGLGVELGRTLRKGCSSCGAWMASAEGQFRLLTDASGPVVVALNPEFGVQLKPNPGATSFMSAAVHLNLSVPVPIASEIALVPFAAPGYGWGRSSFGGTSEMGYRPMLGGGLVVRRVESGLQASLGFSRIFVDDGATVLGASIGYGP
jgi:hypothetical protein